jgi:DNA-binding CsgD family transcriptional regulator
MGSKKRTAGRPKYAYSFGDITDKAGFQDALQWYHERLVREQRNRIEKEAALKQILEHIDREKTAYRCEIVSKVKDLLSPFLARLRDTGAHITASEIDSLERDLDRVAEGAGEDFWNGYARLTPREMDVCKAIKEGLSSKEIALRLGLSLHTVNKHRQQIRRKLRLDNKDYNLASYLRWKLE